MEEELTAFSARCEVVAYAMYPSLTIVDARCKDISTSRLWQWLSVTNINEATNSDLTIAEVYYIFFILLLLLY